MIFEHRIANIPCQIEVKKFKHYPGNFSSTARDPEEYHGYTICDFTVLDRKGYKAPWLEAKLDSDTEAELRQKIAEVMQDDDEDAAYGQYRWGL